MKRILHVFAMVILAGLLTGFVQGQEEQPIDPLDSPPAVPVLGDSIKDGNGDSPVSEAPPEPGPEFIIEPDEEPSGLIDPLISPVIAVGDSPTITPEPMTVDPASAISSTAEPVMVEPIPAATPEPEPIVEPVASWRDNLLWQAWLSPFMGEK